MENNLFIRQVRNRDKQVIEQLVMVNRDMVYRTCLAYVQNKNDAEDLTQEVFIKVLERLNQFKGDSKLSSWIVRIAINLSLNYLRDNKKRLGHLDISDMQHIVQDRSNYMDKEVAKMVRMAIYKLPEKQRKIFVLRFYLDLSYEEISEITEYSVSSIESLLFRARKKLKVLLQKFYEELKR